LLEDQLAVNITKTEKDSLYLENLQVSRSLIQKAAQLTQEKLSIHISDLVSLALRSVFDDPYEFQATFENRRNSMECDLVFVKDGNEYKPLDSCGYGAADVASFALRIAYWSLGETRPVLIWDEPFRQLDKNKQSMAAEMVRKLSKELGLQIIIITHSEELAECANKLFNVSISGGISEVV
jgi:DNA repair exonuclease SbcCD ATPase subunit